LWKVDAKLPDSSEECCLVNAQFLRSGFTVVFVPFKCYAKRLGIEEIMGVIKMRGVASRYAMGGQFFRKMSNLYVSLITEYKGPLNDIFQLAHIARPIMCHEQGERLR
jgi:hypothetical protein